MNCNVSILSYIICMDGTSPVGSSIKYYSLIAAVDLTYCRGSHDGFHTRAGIKHYSHRTVN